MHSMVILAHSSFLLLPQTDHLVLHWKVVFLAINSRLVAEVLVLTSKAQTKTTTGWRMILGQHFHSCWSVPRMFLLSAATTTMTIVFFLWIKKKNKKNTRPRRKVAQILSFGSMPSSTSRHLILLKQVERTKAPFQDHHRRRVAARRRTSTILLCPHRATITTKARRVCPKEEPNRERERRRHTKRTS